MSLMIICLQMSVAAETERRKIQLQNNFINLVFAIQQSVNAPELSDYVHFQYFHGGKYITMCVYDTFWLINNVEVSRFT